jgi:hypothetical protein
MVKPILWFALYFVSIEFCTLTLIVYFPEADGTEDLIAKLTEDELPGDIVTFFLSRLHLQSCVGQSVIRLNVDWPQL